MDSPIDHLHEKVLVNSVLMGAIGEGSKNMDKFSGWLLAGFAAVVAVLFGNLTEASRHLSGSAIQTVFVCFFIVAILGILAKGLAVLVASASAGAAIGRTEGERVASYTDQLDIPWFFGEVERTIIPPVRWLVRSSFAKAAKGDLTVTARLFTLVAQIQALCMALQALVVLFAIAIVVCGVTF